MTASRHRRALVGNAAILAAFGLLAAGCSGTTLVGSIVARSTTSATAGTTATTSTVPRIPGQCDYIATPSQPAPAGHNVGLPPGDAPKAGTVAVTLHTSQGDLPLTLDRHEARCTVGSFVFLAGKGYFNNTSCHRLTTYDGLKVLQCGDPSGTGTGGPGYTIPDENPTNLAPADGNSVVYPRGTVAMANAGPDTGGSQFFLVYGDSQLPPTYSVFGTVGADGLTVLDKVAAGGVAPGGTGPQDGRPVTSVTITTATVATN